MKHIVTSQMHKFSCNRLKGAKSPTFIDVNAPFIIPCLQLNKYHLTLNS